MHLIKLVVKDRLGSIIREVKFKKGLNLILGIPSEKNGSTNNIGKTTLIRCIDFCLNGKIDQFYKDNEFKNGNLEIIDFFKKKEPSFSLWVEKDNDIYIIKRKVMFKNNKFYINNYIFLNNNVINCSFEDGLKKLFFDTDDKKPTLRTLMPKFLRKDSNQIENILKFAHFSKSVDDYEKIHMFLFGFEDSYLLDQKSNLEIDLKKLIDSRKALSSKYSISDLTQIISLKKDELTVLYQQRDGFKINEQYEEEENTLASLQKNILYIEHHIADLKFKMELNSDRLRDIKKNKFDKDLSAIKLMYKEANFYMEKLNKTFEDTVNFHNKMLENEKKYVMENILSLRKKIQESVDKRKNITNQYSHILEKLSRTGSLAEYTRLNQKIEDIVKEIGQREGLLNELIRLEQSIQDIEKNMDELNKDIDQGLIGFDKKLAIFNKFFSGYTKEVYGQEFILSHERGNNSIKFYIRDVSNFGSGKKGAIVILFDLAYIDYINTAGLNYPKFVAMDKIEIVDINELKAIFNISKGVDGQFIVPVIYDKIDSIYENYKDSVILKLSEDDKFFNI